MTTFFTSDLHLGHVRISELAHRPFSNVPAMNAHLIKAWNARVTEQDTVYVLGDVCMGPIQDSLDLIPLLAGRKVLIPGNHDRCWMGHGTRADGWEARYRAAGFDQILHGPVRHEVGGGIRVRLSHFPYAGDSGDADRYVEHRPWDDGETWLIHGHTHGKWRQRGRQIDVGVDAWGGRPVSERALIEMITAGPADIPAPEWHTA